MKTLKKKANHLIQTICPTFGDGVRGLWFVVQPCNTRSFAWDDESTNDGKARRANAWALADFIHVLDQGEFWLQPHERRRAMHAGSLFLLTLQYLAAEAKTNGYTCWFIRPKHHYFEHMKDSKHKVVSPHLEGMNLVHLIHYVVVIEHLAKQKLFGVWCFEP